MVLESTVICVDNSEWMRNGDFLPSRIQAQQDAVSIICHAKTTQNPENNVALLTLASLEVLTTLTTDVGKILTKLHQVQPSGDMHLLTGIRIAHLALKHRQGKNHKMRIVAFVGSPVEISEKELVKVAKKLKKEKVSVDVVCLGEDTGTNEKLSEFINTLNGKEGTGSHLVTVPAGQTLLAEAIRSSPIVLGEDGFAPVGVFGPGFDDVDPNLDPELALALRVSMEEQRQRQDEEARKATEDSKDESAPKPSAGVPTASVTTNEDTLLQRALAMSMGDGSVDFNALSEDEQVAMAIQMSMADSGMTDESDTSRPPTGASDNASLADTPAPMETDNAKEGDRDEAPGDDQQDYSAVMNDPEFLQHLVSSLPGVDPNSEAIRDALGALTQQGGDENQSKDKQKKNDKS